MRNYYYLHKPVRNIIIFNSICQACAVVLSLKALGHYIWKSLYFASIFIAGVRVGTKIIFLRFDDCLVFYGLSIGVTFLGLLVLFERLSLL